MDVFGPRCVVKAIADYFLINYCVSFLFHSPPEGEKRQKWSRDSWETNVRMQNSCPLHLFYLQQQIPHRSCWWKWNWTYIRRQMVFLWGKVKEYREEKNQELIFFFYYMDYCFREVEPEIFITGELNRNDIYSFIQQEFMECLTMCQALAWMKILSLWPQGICSFK